MFSPLAYTLGFALLGALIFTLTLVPVMSSILLKKNVRERSNFLVHFIREKSAALFAIFMPIVNCLSDWLLWQEESVCFSIRFWEWNFCRS